MWLISNADVAINLVGNHFYRDGATVWFDQQKGEHGFTFASEQYALAFYDILVESIKTGTPWIDMNDYPAWADVQYSWQEDTMPVDIQNEMPEWMEPEDFEPNAN